MDGWVPPLTMAQRACLLRAARRRLVELGDERNRLLAFNTDVSAQLAGITEDEIACLMGAVSWLWRGHHHPG